MKKNILLIQGGGEAGYEADTELSDSLKIGLGDDYDVHYPKMQTIESLLDFGWLQQIGNEITAINGEIILVGHSLGASMLLKYLSENKINKRIAGVFLISTPFWNGDEDWVKGLKLNKGFAVKLPKYMPIFMYQCRDDEEIPFEHFLLYKQKLTNALFREIAEGGHQINNDLTIVAEDIKSL